MGYRDCGAENCTVGDWRLDRSSRTFGTYHIIHQPITRNDDNVTLFDGHIESHCVFHGFISAVRADLCSYSWAHRDEK